MKAKEAHLVMINYYYPPMKSPGVTRNFNFSLSFSKYFKTTTVFTTTNRNILTQDHFDMSELINIQEVKTTDYRTLSANRKKSNSIHFDDKKKSSFIVKFGIKLIDSFPFNIIFGEGGFIYLWKSYSMVSNFIKDKENVVIYSSFRPYTDLYVGYLLKKKNSRIKWIADFRDLHVEPIYKNVFFPEFQIWWNRKMLKKADIVTSVSKGLIHQLEKYNRPTFPFINGVTLRKKQPFYDKFTISYTGSLFKNERDPSILFESISSLLRKNLISKDHFQIVYAGNDGNKFQSIINVFGLQDLFVNHGMVSRQESLLIQSKSQLNLLLSVNSEEHKGVLTGKLFEYLGALNSIVLIIIGKFDQEFESMFEDCKAGRIFYTKESNRLQIDDYILNFYNDWVNDKLAPNSINPEIVVKNFSWDNSVSQLLKEINITF